MGSPHTHSRPTAIHCVRFKKDLRITDHRPLVEAVNAVLATSSGGLIVGLYCFEPSIEGQPDYSTFHRQHIIESVDSLRKKMDQRGIPLLVYHGEVTDIFGQLKKEGECPITLYVHEETGNRASYQRDLDVIKRCSTVGVPFKEYPNNGTVRRLKNRDHRSAMRNARMDAPQYSLPNEGKQGFNRVSLWLQQTFPGLLTPIDTYRSHIALQVGGTDQARTYMSSFLSTRSTQYLYTIGKPHESTQFSSRISPYLAYGSVSIKQIDQAARAKIIHLNSQQKNTDPMSPEYSFIKSHKRQLRGFISRLHRHDHFIQKLESDPMIELKNVHPYYDRIRRPEDTNEEYIRRFEEGTTGIPLIDAAIRCVKTTGRLNFRLRATLTSFICNTCMQDRRRPAHLMAQWFTDYEPGIHYSQFQMQAGTAGINQYRIYNPIKQTIEKDPDGTFIDLRCPELRDIPMPLKAQPWLLEQRLGLFGGPLDYPSPMVDIEHANREAKKTLRGIKALPGFKDHAQRIYEKLGSRSRSKNRNGNRKKTKQ